MNVSIILFLAGAIYVSFCAQGCDNIFDKCSVYCYFTEYPKEYSYVCVLPDEEGSKACQCVSDETHLTTAIDGNSGKKYACAKSFTDIQASKSQITKCDATCVDAHPMFCESPKGICECKDKTSDAVGDINKDYLCGGTVKATTTTTTKAPVTIQTCKTGCAKDKYFCMDSSNGNTCVCADDADGLTSTVQGYTSQYFGCAETALVPKDLVIDDVETCFSECIAKTSGANGNTSFCLSPKGKCNCGTPGEVSVSDIETGTSDGSFCGLTTCQLKCRSTKTDYFCISKYKNYACGCADSDTKLRDDLNGLYYLSCELSNDSHEPIDSETKKKCSADKSLGTQQTHYCVNRDGSMCMGFTNDQVGDMELLVKKGFACGGRLDASLWG